MTLRTCVGALLVCCCLAADGDAEGVPEGSSGTGNASGAVVLTGDPQKDYIHDPNLPYELHGYDLSTYPFYNSMPDKINFTCDGRHDGFYANVEHRCQIYHQCLFGTRYDFLCANFTAFDQKNFICHFASEVDCDNSPKHYNRNNDLYQTTTTTTQKPTSASTTSASTSLPPENLVYNYPLPFSGFQRSFSRPWQYDYYDYYDEFPVDDYMFVVRTTTPSTTTTPRTKVPLFPRLGNRRKLFLSRFASRRASFPRKFFREMHSDEDLEPRLIATIPLHKTPRKELVYVNRQPQAASIASLPSNSRIIQNEVHEKDDEEGPQEKSEPAQSSKSRLESRKTEEKEDSDAFLSALFSIPYSERSSLLSMHLLGRNKAKEVDADSQKRKDAAESHRAAKVHPTESRSREKGLSDYAILSFKTDLSSETEEVPITVDDGAERPRAVYGEVENIGVYDHLGISASGRRPFHYVPIIRSRNLPQEVKDRSKNLIYSVDQNVPKRNSHQRLRNSDGFISAVHLATEIP